MSAGKEEKTLSVRARLGWKANLLENLHNLYSSHMYTHQGQAIQSSKKRWFLNLVCGTHNDIASQYGYREVPCVVHEYISKGLTYCVLVWLT